MSASDRIRDLIEEQERLRNELLGDAPTSERIIEAALAANIRFTQSALLVLARELEELRALIERESRH